MKLFPFLCALAIALCSGLIFPISPANAQSKGAADANTAAYEQFASGNYQAAADAYTKLLADYPTDAIVPGATLQLAFCYYFLGKFSEAEAAIAKASSGPPIGAELQEVADGLLPQIQMAKAAALTAGDAAKTAAFNDAIAKFSTFLSKYPNSADAESMTYSLALAQYQTQKFDDAIKTLEGNIQRFGTSSTIPASRNLLAIVLATEGGMELAKGSGANSKLGMELLQKSIELLRQIIKSKQDIALINDANFQLGEILLTQAAYSPEAERPALYKEALAAFRAVAPQEQIVALQKEKINGFRDRRRQAVLQKNAALLKRLDKENEREVKKLAELQSKPDQMATALQKMGEINFQSGKNNEARVLFTHVKPFLKRDDDKKRNLYFTTMSYASQNAAEKAQLGYDQFEKDYKSDAIADNLPLTLGNMYLALNNPTEAVKYFDESLQLYPNGRFAGVSVVSKATAESKLGKSEEALATFRDYLSKNPPPEVGAIAQAGIAGIYKDTQKWDDAVNAYNEVKQKYPNSPQAVEADYWIAVCTQQKGDNAASIPLLEAFLKNNPTSPLAPLAMYAKASAQISLGQKEEGIATLAALAAQYPQSAPAPFTYFMRAQLRGQEGKADDVVALMKEFVEKYPADDKVYFAYDSIAQTQINSGKPDEAVATYLDFTQKYSEAPKAAEALHKIADLKRATAEGIGRYGALNTEEQEKWKNAINESIATSEEMLKKYPDSPDLAIGLRTLLEDQRLLMSSGLKSNTEVEQYFQSLADSAGSPGAKSKILFVLASYVGESDQAKSLEIMTRAYDPSIMYSPQDLDAYGLALVAQNKLDEANAVFEKLQQDYPLPPNAPPAQASPTVQEAQAVAMFGKGRIAQVQNKTAEAGQIFSQLKTLYPWSPKVLEADFGIAQSLKGEGKYDDALNLLTAIIRAPTATAELRAESMLLGGSLMVDKMNAATDAKEKSDFLAAAIDYYIKIAQFYAGVQAAASEGLWQGGQLLEQQAAGLQDAKAKAQQLGRAKAAYQQLVTDFPNSEYVAKAQERLAALK